jgi:hypothetical protein
VRIEVRSGESFACPACGQVYEVEEYEEGVAVLSTDRHHPCSHVDREVLPTPCGWEVYFREEE